MLNRVGELHETAAVMFQVGELQVRSQAADFLWQEEGPQEVPHLS